MTAQPIPKRDNLKDMSGRAGSKLTSRKLVRALAEEKWQEPEKRGLEGEIEELAQSAGDEGGWCDRSDGSGP